MAIREVREMGDDVLGGSCSTAGWYSQTDCSD